MTQREIKFRAWDKEKNKFVCEHTLESLINTTAHLETDYIWTQFTGLLDKNGKEIYEGDIVTGDKIVEWQGGAWGFSNVVWHNKIQVIGNIYENPNLLK